MALLVLLLLLFQLAVAGANLLHPSCVFNPLCSCSRSDANLGIVTCVNTPLFKIPAHINRSRINSFHLENNGLMTIEPSFLSGTGLQLFKITRNPVHTIHRESFRGLENSLRELELSYLNLVEVPRSALTNLLRLQSLNLAGNIISDVSQTNWILTLRGTLETLVLKDNSISYVPANAFERFSKLKVLDLSGNVLLDMDPDVFFPETYKITHLNLADNHLRHIPYVQLQKLRSLRSLDVSYNFITKINSLAESTRTEIDGKFSLNTINLKYNDVRTLSAEDFEKFSVLNGTFLDGNPITTIQMDTFQNVRIRELSFSGCGLITFTAGMIKGLERSLVTLDLSFNHLSTIDSNLFRHFAALQELKMLGNPGIENFAVPDHNNNIFALEVSGNERTNHQGLLQDIGKIKSLIRIIICDVEIPTLTASYFFGYGFGVEELSVRRAKLKSIQDQTFSHVRGLRKLDLSDNELSDVHEHAFAEIGRSLISLNLANAFSSSVNVFPSRPMTHLYSLQIFDISNNRFEELPEDTLYGMHDLEMVRVHDCQIKVLKKDTFQSEIHTNLKEVTFSFNHLKVLKTNTFSDLKELCYLNFEDSFIETIEHGALNNLKSLRWIYLRGNKIEEIHRNAFSNLPQLELLDLAYNKLKIFDFTCLDQSMTFLTLNLSFNDIYSLEPHSESYELNIKTLDLSHNSITDISENYFTPLGYSLTHLYLSHNGLANISEDVFGELGQLQWLDFSHNRISHIDHYIFREIRSIQVLNISNNELQDIPPNVFHGINGLRIIDLSNNKLNFIPEFSFREDTLESISLARNRFLKIPYKSFGPEVARSLRALDASENEITAILSSDLISEFKSLESLDVSSNRINKFENAVLHHLDKLLFLDLSHNSHLQFVEYGPSFTGLHENLLSLGLTNVSLMQVPNLPFPGLLYLRLSNNNISALNPETVMNLTLVRVLDLSRNNFSTLPAVLLSMKSLKSLNISENPVIILTNNSLLNGLVELQELDMTRLPLYTLETGVLSRLISMNTLHISTYEDVDLIIPKLLEKNHALEHLHVEVTVKHLNNEMRGSFPNKLRKVTITGNQLESLDGQIFMGISNPTFNLHVEGTGLQYLDGEVFYNLHRVRNITVSVLNNRLKYMANPSTGQSLNLFNRTFLVKLQVSSNAWNCKCDIGWIETWQRTARQLICSHTPLSMSKNTHECMSTEEDLRQTCCIDNRTLMQVMKTELECGWSRSSYHIEIKLEYSLMFTLIWLLNYVWNN